MREQIIRYRELRKRIGLSRTTVWRLIREGRFPRPLPLTARLVGFRESDVEAWIESRANRDANKGTR
jgi:prophage regulatory protein